MNAAPVFTSPRRADAPSAAPTRETETPKDAIQNARQTLRGLPFAATVEESDAILAAADRRLRDALDLLEPGRSHA